MTVDRIRQSVIERQRDSLLITLHHCIVIVYSALAACYVKRNNSKTMFIVLSSFRAIARVHPVHLMNVERRQDDQRPTQTTKAVIPPYRLPESTPTIAIYYYYSARKLTLILPSHGV